MNWLLCDTKWHELCTRAINSFTLTAAFIPNETDRTFKGLNVLRLKKMIKGQRVSQPKYILNLLIRVVRDEREWLAN